MEKQMSVGDWIITYLITCIPLVGLIMLFVWGFGEGHQPSKKTWAQATLLWVVIVFVLWLVLGSLIMGLFLSGSSFM